MLDQRRIFLEGNTLSDFMSCEMGVRQGDNKLSSRYRGEIVILLAAGIATSIIITVECNIISYV